MAFQGRSPDDLPLAAYSTGVVNGEPDEEIVDEPTHPLSQQEAIALAMGIDAPAKPEPAKAATAKSEAAKSEPEPDAPRRGPRRPRLSLPRPSLPRPTMPTMPRLGVRNQVAAVADSPFHLEPPAMTKAVAHVPAATSALQGARMTAATPRATGIPRAPWRPNIGDLGTKLRDPRTAVRDPRVLVGGVIGIGVVLLGVSLLGGGIAGGGPVPDASPSAGPGIGVPAGPGPATLQVTGRFDGSFTLTGTAGFGKPADGQLASTWADSAGAALALTGRVGSGMRTTSGELVLSVTVPVGGTPVLFESTDAECFVNMAEKMGNVTGSFVCEEITSTDGRTTVKITGTYQT
jgi:hypothetical protein